MLFASSDKFLVPVVFCDLIHIKLNVQQFNGVFFSVEFYGDGDIIHLD